MKRRMLISSILASTAAIGTGAPLPAVAQTSLQIDEIVVTARRREERLQDVPVSISVLSQQQLANYNISNVGEIALYTPSVSTNSRWGDDLATFTIRGFTQESRTTASVGVYFADVVAPRGASSQTSGDGAGPGMMFDLENIQVLKGPQGTLFGRNTTGGAVLLVPRKPTDQFEGYVEASAGNYDMRQFQGVVNIPLADRARLRLGVDHKKRDGHLKNVGTTGPSHFSDVDYISARASLVLDITDSLENYTILTYSESDNKGSFPTVTHCNSSAMGGGMFGGFLGDMCQDQLNRQAAAGSTGFWDTASSLPNPRSEKEEWRAINTTTWTVSDNFTVKNIISYGRLETLNNSPAWGSDYWFQPFMNPANAIPYRYAAAGARGDGVKTTDMSSFVEELQFQGLAFDSKLSWQAGLYYERAKPEDTMGQASPVNISCDFETLASGNLADWRCNDLFAGLSLLQMIEAGMLPPEAYGNEQVYLGGPLRVGNAQITNNGMTYTNRAVYAQGTWQFNEQWSATAGLRYTWDKTSGFQDAWLLRFPYDPLTGQMSGYEFIETPPRVSATQKSDEPTWTLGVEYKPTQNTMWYAKYTRGYRQGSVNAASQPGLVTFDPEQVDTYEVGLKTVFDGKLRGTFNAAIFYNDFQDQQLQNGIVLSQEYSGVGSTAIVNAGKSMIQGVELDGSLLLGDNLTLSASYAYLDTEVKELEDITARIIATGATPAALAAAEGDTLPYAPKHNFVLSANYRLPTQENIGDIVVGATYVYSDSMRASASTEYSPFSELPSYEIVNLHLNWNRVANSAFDLSLFVTNVTNEEYYVFANGNFSALESESALPGHPRMYGARVRYSFGALGR